MIKTTEDEIKLFSSYCDLLERTIRDIDAISQEFDMAFLNNMATKVPQDIRFDAVPMLRKLKNAQKFLLKGDKVKFTIRFKGRELQHSNLGSDLMIKIKEDLKEIGKIELNPKFDGKQMIMIVQPL